MSDWNINLGLGAFVRATGGVTLRGEEDNLSLNLELSPGFVGAAETRIESSVDSFGGSENRRATRASIEFAPTIVIASRPGEDGRLAPTAGMSLSVRAPIPATLNGRTIHPVSPYASFGFLTNNVPGSGVSFRFSLGADFTLIEEALGGFGLNVNYTLVGDNEHSFNAGLSGYFDILGELRSFTTL
jgi:hypothetical protein